MPKLTMDEATKLTYLAVLYELEEEGKKPAPTLEIAKRLCVKPASVSEMLTKLAKEKLIEHAPYKGTSLTPSGRELGIRAVRRARLVGNFLHTKLNLSKEETIKELKKTHLGDQTDVELCKFLKRPTEDSITHKPIPHCSKKISCEQCLKS